MCLKTLPPWPREIPRIWRDLGTLTGLEPLDARRHRERLALERAALVREREDAIQNSFVTGTVVETLWTNAADGTAHANSTSEVSLLTGLNDQPVLPALFFHNKVGRQRLVSLLARGVFSTTGTPTLIFQVRLGETAGASFVSGTSVGVSAAITTGSGVSNKWWELRLDLMCRTPGIGANNTTLAGSGYVKSPTGFASPFLYPLEPTTPDTATWTATINNAVTQYLNVSATWSAASASNTITMKECYFSGNN